MSSYEILTIDEDNFREVAALMARSIDTLNGDVGSDIESTPRGHENSTGEHYRWLLDEGNPSRDEGIPPGEIIRNDQGAVVGMIGYHPQFFRWGDRRVRGLGAHNFYIDPMARMQGFLLFRRYLNHPRADFCYSTSCNSNSGPLWSKCGASQVPASDVEYLLIYRMGPVLQELALNRGVPRSLAMALRTIGPLASLAVRPRKSRGRLSVERCSDWDRLEAIAERNRDPLRLTPERSAADLRRRHEAICLTGSSHDGAGGLYRFADSKGREGWFSLRENERGRLGQIRGVTLHDVVWPRGFMEFWDILTTINDVVAGRADLLSIRDRLALGLGPSVPGLRRRIFPFPEAFVFSRTCSGLPSSNELAKVADFPAAYGV